MGGAAIVASHIASLKSKCEFISVIGEDDQGKWLQNQLENNSVKVKLFIDKKRPTTFKKRYLVENQKLFRVSRLDDHIINRQITKNILNHIENISDSISGIIISDFVYGLITEDLISGIVKCAKK